MALRNPLARLVFTTIWGTKLNRAGFTVRAVHSVNEATVWDGAEERLIRFYMFGRRIAGKRQPEAKAEVPHTPANVTPAVEPAEYLWHDSRAPFAMALGATRRLRPTVVQPASNGTASAPTMRTQAPFPSIHLAD